MQDNRASFDRFVSELERHRQFYYGKAAQKQQLENNLAKLLAEIQQLEEKDLAFTHVQKFFQSMGSSAQGDLQAWIEKLVTYGLQSVLGPTYSFRITKPEIKANEVVVSFKVIQTKNEVEYERDVYTEMGGGVADVLSFLLQFIVVYLLRDRIQPILLLDEAFKHLSVEFREDMAELLRELCDRTGVQILMVTHDPIYERVADRVYRFSQPGVETLAEEIK